MGKLHVVVYTAAILILVLFSALGTSIAGASQYISPAGYIKYNIFLYNSTASAAGVHPIAVACNPTNGYLYVLTTDSVYIVDPLNNSVVGRISFIPTLNPTGIVYDPQNGYIYIAVNGSSIIAVDPVTDRIVAGIPVHGEVLQMIYVDGYIYAAVTSSDSVAVIDPTDSSVVAMIKVGSTPIGLAYDPDDKYVYAADFGSGEVSVISTMNDSVVANISVGGFPWGIAYDPSNGYVYVSEYNGRIAVIDPLTDRVIANISLPYGSPRWAIYDPGDGYVYVLVLGTAGNYVAAVGPNNTVIGTVQLGFLPSGITYDAATGYLYVTGLNTGTVSVIITPRLTVMPTTTGTSATNTTAAQITRPSETGNRAVPTPSPIDMVVAVIGGLIIATFTVILLRIRK